MARLRFGRWVCEVEDALLEAAAPRCSVAPFLTEEAPRLWLRRLPSLGPGAHPFHPEQPAMGSFAVAAEGLATDARLELFPAEFALRALYQLAVLRQGGLTLHGAGMAFGEAGLVALGPSGAGKSTLARLCAHSRRAEVLSDELVALLPDGSLHGSPFRSEPDLPATRAEARAQALLLLVKGQAEALAPVPAQALVAPLLGQVFQGGAVLGPGAEKLQRVGRVAESVPGFRLTFRKVAAVADFLEGWVHGAADSSR